MWGIDEEQPDQSYGRERDQFRVGGDLGEDARFFDTPQIYEHHRPDSTKRQQHGHCTAVQRRKQVEGRAGKGDGNHGKRCPDWYPIAPGNQKASEVAVSHAGIGVWASGGWRERCKLGESQTKAHGADAHNNPK